MIFLVFYILKLMIMIFIFILLMISKFHLCQENAKNVAHQNISNLKSCKKDKIYQFIKNMKTNYHFTITNRNMD